MANAVTKDLYGVGFSPLSIINKKYAQAEELLSEKTLGMLAIYQENGNVISADQIQREKHHLEEFINDCITTNTLGKIYKINIDDKLVQNIIATQNLFSNTVTISNGADPISFIRLSIDADCFKKETNSYLDPSDFTISLNFSLSKNGVAKDPFKIEESIMDINQRAYAINWDQFTDVPDTDTNTFDITLNSLVIDVPAGFDDSKFGFVVRDVLFAVH